MEQYLKIFKALGDQSRLRITLMLLVKPMCVCEIRAIIGSSMSTISNHLRILKEADIIAFRKEDKYIIYSLNTSRKIVQQILNMLKEINDNLLSEDKLKAFKTSRFDICTFNS